MPEALNSSTSSSNPPSAQVAEESTRPVARPRGLATHRNSNAVTAQANTPPHGAGGVSLRPAHPSRQPLARSLPDWQGAGNNSAAGISGARTTRKASGFGHRACKKKRPPEKAAKIQVQERPRKTSEATVPPASASRSASTMARRSSAAGGWRITRCKNQPRRRAKLLVKL